MTSWSRRVSAAAARPTPGVTRRSPRLETLAAAATAGVIDDDLASLAAIAGVARDRPGYRLEVEVRTHLDDEPGTAVFEVLNTEQGVVIRPVSVPLVPSASSEAGEADIVTILTDTLVATPDLVAVFASVGHEALWANDAFATVIPIRAVDKVWLVELLDEWSKGHYEVKVLPALVKYGRWRGRLTLLTGEGEMPVSAVIVAHRDRHGEIEAVTMVAREPTDTHVEEAAETRFATLVEHVSDMIAVLDEEGVVQYASPATHRVLGLDEAALAGANFLDLLHPDDRPDDLLELALPDEQGIGTPVELRVHAADGGWRHLEVVVTDLADNPAIGGVVVNARDITERIEAINALTERALTDELTELPGRLKLLDRLASVLQRGPEPGSVFVLLVNLDRVRNVNDLLGRDAGDELIRTAAHRLADHLGPGMFLARLGSDEFVIVVEGVSDRSAPMRTAINLRRELAEPMDLAGGPFDVTSSMGIAVWTGTELDPEELLRQADRAVSHAKALGRDRIEVYTDEMSRIVTRRRSVERQLRHALDNDGVRVHYQPIVDLSSGRVSGVEALLRVHAGAGDLLSPDQFLEAAESSGLIARLGAQVLQTTCAQLAGWSGEGGVVPNEITVNISPRQLADPDLPSHVVAALHDADVAPARLWLEITESILIGAQPTVDTTITFLRGLGVRIGLDDFGAGHSSLGYLKRFPLDFLKIDRSLVNGLGVDEQSTAIVRATIELAHNLGLVVVAVGVESPEQLEFLRLLECDRVQGHLFSEPLPAEDLPRRLASVSLP